jgi:DNA-binding MarR family transcriptional regulator
MQGRAAAELVTELEALFSLLARTGAGLSDGPALTSTQRVVLIELVSTGPLRLGALAGRIGLSDPTVSRAVDGMVEAGIVERQQDPDDRRAVLHLATADGRDWVERRRREVEAALADSLEGLSATDRARLMTLIAKLNDELRAAESKHPPRSGALLATR